MVQYAAMYTPHHHLALTGTAALGAQLAGSGVSLVAGVRYADAFAALGASAAALASAWVSGSVRRFGRRWVAVALLAAWSVRLSVFLFARNKPSAVRLAALATSRTLWSAGAALPVVLLLSSSAPDTLTAGERLAAFAGAAAIALEAAADRSKSAWWRGAGPTEEDPVLAEGLWALSRHPNLFGEALLHLALCALTVRGADLVWLSVLGAAAMASHVALGNSGPLVALERRKAVMLAKNAAYAEYVSSTSVFVPLPRRAWAALGPRARALLFERKDWHKDATVELLISAYPQ